MRLIVLWDIDHTLIDNAGVSKEIYAAAFTALSGVEPVAPAMTEGRTDRLIMREMFLRHGPAEPDWPLIEQALTCAGQERLGELRVRGTELPGVRDALKAVAEQAGWVSSVLTGNIEANARVKLAAFGLSDMLDLSVGAYGADAVERAELVTVARDRVRSVYGGPEDVPVVLVGDTPRDVEAALTAGAHVVAVASGVHSTDDLASAGAPVVLPDLSDTTGLLRRLEGFAAH